MNKLTVLLLVNLILIGAVWAAGNEYTDRIEVLSDHILITAEQLKDATDDPVFDSLEVDEILTDLKSMITEYENMMVFAESPYPGEILLATTPGGDDTRLEALCNTRYDGPMKEIRIRRSGSRARYLRINDIELTYVTADGPRRETFNRSGRFRLYSSGVFRLALPRPMRIRRIRINIEHESNGLQIYGVPLNLPLLRPEPRRNLIPTEALLGTTPAGKDTWLETICSNPYRRPIREIQLKRTGREASYLRINDIEVTFLTPQGPKKQVFNKSGRYRLYPNGVFRLALPRPMRVVRIRVLIAHESTGLNVYGIY